MSGSPTFTFTRFDRVRLALARLSYGLVTWRGYDARRLAAVASAGGRTAVVVACRFQPGFMGPSASREWGEVRVFVGDERLVFMNSGRRTPAVVDVAPGACRLRIEHEGPPPSFETTVEVGAGRTVLVEVRPEATHVFPWLRRSPTVAIWDGDRGLRAEHAL